MEKTNNNVLQIFDLQVVVAEVWAMHQSSGLRSKFASVVLTSAERRVRVSTSLKCPAAALCLKRRLFFPRLFTQRTNCMRSGRCSSLLMPLAAVAGRFRGQCTWGQFTLLCGDSCGRSPSRGQPPQTGMKGPRRSTRSAPLCGGRGWCGFAGRPGLTTPWVGSSAGTGCRSWNRPVCWPSEGSPVHTATEKRQSVDIKSSH